MKKYVISKKNDTFSLKFVYKKIVSISIIWLIVKYCAPCDILIVIWEVKFPKLIQLNY